MVGVSTAMAVGTSGLRGGGVTSRNWLPCAGAARGGGRKVPGAMAAGTVTFTGAASVMTTSGLVASRLKRARTVCAC